jgi:hypothetical protein
MQPAPTVDTDDGLTIPEARVLRHNEVNRAAAKFSHLCGATTKEEPASLVRRVLPSYGDYDDDGAEDNDAAAPLERQVSFADGEAGWQSLAGTDAKRQVARRADLLVATGEYFGFVDTSIAHPATSALCAGRAPAVTERTLVAAELCEKRKVKQYAECPEYDQYEVTPLVLESFGGIGAKAVAFIKRMARLSDREYRMEELGLDMLAVALARGNAQLELAGIPIALRAAHTARCGARMHPRAVAAAGS